MKPAYLDFLTKEERAGAMKLGAIYKFAENGIPVQSIDNWVKKADTSSLVNPTNWAKGVAMLSLLAGIPMGVAAHAIGNQVTGTRKRETELQEKIKQYRAASGDLEQGLAAGGAY